jgi:hypothetical protein
MRDNTIERNISSPFIMLFAESRGRSLPLPGAYDEELQVVVSNESGKRTPLIKAYTSSEIFTKTEADRESDEHTPLSLKAVARTVMGKESDDTHIRHAPDLLTKTFVERESDDDRSFSFELQTKTRMDREGDDSHCGF